LFNKRKNHCEQFWSMIEWFVRNWLCKYIWIRKLIEGFAHKIERVNYSSTIVWWNLLNMRVHRLGIRVHEFKKSDPIPKPITCGYNGLGRILPVYERVRVNNGLDWVGSAGSRVDRYPWTHLLICVCYVT
jgi:hypothetical protein